MKIEDMIPIGYSNRIDRVALEIRTGLGDRANRRLIEEAMINRGVMICNVGNGYFRPDGSTEDMVRWRKYCLKELKRCSTQNRKSVFLRSTLPPERNELEKNQMNLSEFGI